MIEFVTLAEERLARNRKTVFKAAALPSKIAPVAEVAPILRGACSLKHDRIEGAWRRMILEFRASEPIANFVNGAEVERYARAGVITPDHHPHQELAADPAGAEAGAAHDFKRAVAKAAGPSSRTAPICTPRRASAAQERARSCLRVALVPGPRLPARPHRQGCPDRGRSCRGDHRRHHRREAIGRYQSISEADMFDLSGA